jgi:hypothetical protein
MSRKKKDKAYPITEEQEQIMKMFLLKMKEECDEINELLKEVTGMIEDFYNEDVSEQTDKDNDSGEYNWD